MLRRVLPLLFIFALAACAHADWEQVSDGVEYRRIARAGIDVHVVRIDLDAQGLRLIATGEADSGTTVSEFAKRKSALVAINADYFDQEMLPIGFAMGDCEVWGELKDRGRRQPVVVTGSGKAAILSQTKVAAGPPKWASGAVSGWPMLVENCAPLPTLPGSDTFSRAPHPRTAVGLSKDQRQMVLLVADGRRQGVPGMTLPELARFMAGELDVCLALNLDGGGSSAMWVADRIVNQPSDGPERRVTNHLAVVPGERADDCAAGSGEGRNKE